MEGVQLEEWNWVLLKKEESYQLKLQLHQTKTFVERRQRHGNIQTTHSARLETGSMENDPEESQCAAHCLSLSEILCVL